MNISSKDNIITLILAVSTLCFIPVDACKNATGKGKMIKRAGKMVFVAAGGTAAIHNYIHREQDDQVLRESFVRNSKPHIENISNAITTPIVSGTILKNLPLSRTIQSGMNKKLTKAIEQTIVNPKARVSDETGSLISVILEPTIDKICDKTKFFTATAGAISGITLGALSEDLTGTLGKSALKGTKIGLGVFAAGNIAYYITKKNPDCVMQFLLPHYTENIETPLLNEIETTTHNVLIKTKEIYKNNGLSLHYLINAQQLKKGSFLIQEPDTLAKISLFSHHTLRECLVSQGVPQFLVNSIAPKLSSKIKENK